MFSTYNGRKNVFEQEILIDYFQKKRKYDEESYKCFKLALDKEGYRLDDNLNSDSDDDVNKFLIYLRL